MMDYLQIKIDKTICSRNQNYEECAKLRDIERLLARDIYINLTKSSINDYDWNKFEELIFSHILEEYKVDFNEIDESTRLIKIKSILIKINRDNKLSDLGFSDPLTK